MNIYRLIEFCNHNAASLCLISTITFHLFTVKSLEYSTKPLKNISLLHFYTKYVFCPPNLS